MTELDLKQIARTAERAADLARREIIPRFRCVGVETKADGTPVTQADRAAEKVMREIFEGEYPEFSFLGEESGEARRKSRYQWVVDPIDGTLSFTRGLPFFATLIALLEDGEPVLGVIDLPMLDQRYVGWKGAGCRCNGVPVHVSQETDLKRAIISHGDPAWFEKAGEREAFLRLATEIPFLRGYTDAFGHAQVLSGGVDAMIDLDLSPWDTAASKILIREAGGVCHEIAYPNQKAALLLGSPALVEQLRGFLERAG